MMASDRRLKVVVIGSGYVGLVTGVALTTLGHEVVAVDLSAQRVADLRSGRTPFFETGLDALLAAALRAGLFTATTDLAAAMTGAHVSIIAVGTPSTEHGIDLGAVSAASREVGRALTGAAPFHVVTVKSTVVPMTTETTIRHALEEASGGTAGVDFGLCMNPEFLREGCAVEDALGPDRIVLGTIDPRSDEVLRAMYAGFGCPIVSTTPRNAEMIKYASNALLATLISYANDVARLCESCDGLSEEVVMNGVFEDRRFWCAGPDGGERLRPGLIAYLRGGIGFGGSCFPKDVQALSMFAAERGTEIKVVDAALAVNEARSEEVVAMIESCIPGGIEGRRVALLGLAFKPDTDDLRESPALRILKALRRSGAEVVCHDPMADYGLAASETGTRFERASSAADALRGADAAIIATSWREYRDLDWGAAAASMAYPLVFDGRQVIAPQSRRAGLHYLCSGVRPRAIGADALPG